MTKNTRGKKLQTGVTQLHKIMDNKRKQYTMRQVCMVKVDTKVDRVKLEKIENTEERDAY